MEPLSTHPRLELRESTPEDRELLYRVYASTRQEELAQTGWTSDAVDAFLRDQFRLQDKHYRQYYPQARFQVVLVDGQPAGRLYVQALDDGIRVIDIALLPAFRGCGFGKALLKDLMAQADAQGLPLSLHVEFNNPIRAYYQRLGFKETPLEGVYYFMERLPLAP